MLSFLLLLQIPAMDYARIAHLQGKFMAVCHRAEDAPKVMIPLPRDYRGQVPLSFTLSITNKGFVSARTYATPTGDQIAEITLKSMKRNDRVDIEWKSDVLVRSIERFDLPATVPFPDSYPEGVQPWLKPSRFVDSDNAKIVALSRTMKGADVKETIDKTVTSLVNIHSKQKGQAREMTASTALTTRGSCTSNANLLAALLRANGVPARILSGYPTWTKDPYQTHYIVEAYVPSFGWYPIESTLFAKGWPCSDMPIVSIVSHENENLGIERLNGGGGVPYLSLTESSDGMLVRGTLTKTFSDHRATLDPKDIQLAPSSWPDAQKRWADWLERTRTEWKDLSTQLPLSRRLELVTGKTIFESEFVSP